MALCRLLLAVVACTVAAPTLSAWNDSVHRAVARVAQERLSANAARRHRYLMGANAKLEDVAAYADSVVGERPETEAWRSITIPPGAKKVELKRDCPVGDCVTAKIRELEGVVRLAVREKSKVQESFRFLIGLAADLHQPLNAGFPPDRGGERTVLLEGEEAALYDVWDSRLFAEANEDELAARLRELITAENARQWSQGTLRDWTWETHRMAVEVAYDGVGVDSPQPIDEVYLHRARETAELQLAKAAVRLAVLLDRIWP